jgi:serine-type D-Ala-D-Ala carboxypeptidase/endopeptidase (penicillin-binding protein 4)
MLGVRRPVTILAVAFCSLACLTGVAAAAKATKAGASARQTLDRALNHGIGEAGSSSSAYVLDLTTGQALYSYKAQTTRLPASVEKLYTTSTALLRFGPDATLTTSVFGDGFLGSGGVYHGTLFLKGGGDPTFGSSSFDQANYGTGATLQRLVANLITATGIKAVQGNIVADGSYFDSLRGTPATGFAPSIYVEGVLDGVAYDRGWLNSDGTVYQAHPTLYAAQQFAAALRAAGVSVPKSTPVSSETTPATATQLAVVHSPTIATLLRLTNTPSDNFLAETLLKDIGARFGGRGSTAAGAAVVRAELASRFGIAPRLDDGSGLSYSDATSPYQVVTLLDQMADNRLFVNSLAIAGETGTLQQVDPGTYARGHCQGKTGTLATVANTVGYCQARDGHTLAFAFLVNGNRNTAYVHNVVEANMMTALANYDD